MVNFIDELLQIRDGLPYQAYISADRILLGWNTSTGNKFSKRMKYVGTDTHGEESFLHFQRSASG